MARIITGKDTETEPKLLKFLIRFLQVMRFYLVDMRLDVSLFREVSG